MSLPFLVTDFTCQVSWARGCPNTWSNVILVVPMRVFWDEINIWICRLSKTDCPPQYGWTLSDQLEARIEQNVWSPNPLHPVRRNSSCPTALKWDMVLFLPLDWNISFSWVSRLPASSQMDLILLALQILRPLFLDLNYIVYSPGSPACQLQIFSL